VINDVMAGQLDSSFATLGSVLPLIQAGKLRALAQATPKRTTSLPDVPTFAQAGFAGYSADIWYGLLAPTGTPTAAIQRLVALSVQFSELANTQSKLQSFGLETKHICTDAFGAQIARDIKVNTSLAKELNIKAD
jgi:tripartite-type tricarboxylate transporter receptor subunit TctC